MKQITHDFGWHALAWALVAEENVEDGFWQINIITETLTTVFPPPGEGALDMILPGQLTRVRGVQFRKVPEMGFMCVEVRDGQIVRDGFAFNTDQRGPEESGGSPGEDSRVVSFGDRPQEPS